MNLEQAKTLKVGDRLNYNKGKDFGTVAAIMSSGIGIRWDNHCGDGVWGFDQLSRVEPVIAPWVGRSYQEVCNQNTRLGEDLNKALNELADYKRELAKIEKVAADLRLENEALHGRTDRLREAVKKAWKQGAENRRLATAWEEDAKRFSRNETYYRDMLLQIAEVLGPEKFICDSGDIAQDVLVAKVPELARAAILGAKSAEQKAKIVPAPECPQPNAMVSDGATDNATSPVPSALPAAEFTWQEDMNKQINELMKRSTRPLIAVDYENYARQQQHNCQAASYRHILEAAGFVVAEEPQRGPYDAIVTNAAGERYGVTFCH